jgi:predicted branched-subunit amino acid permease
MSGTTFAGSAQFAAASVLADGGGLLAAVAAALLLNARYGPIALSVAPSLSGPRRWRFVVAQLVVDESWAIAAGADGRIAARRLVGAGLAIYLGWVAGTVVGVAAGSALTDPETLGLDAAFPALFLGLLAPRLRDARSRSAAIAGAVIALALVPFTPPGVPIVAAALGSLAGVRPR